MGSHLPLRKQMNVRGAEQDTEVLHRLERQEGHVSRAIRTLFQGLASDSITTDHEMRASMLKEPGALHDRLKALLCPERAGVEGDNGVGLNSQLPANRVRATHWENRSVVKEITKERNSFRIYSLCRRSLSHR